jgi:hypothetical protein
MNEHRYSNLALTLSLIAFAFSICPFTVPVITKLVIMPILTMCFNIHIEHSIFFKSVFDSLRLLSWVPGLAIGLVAYMMGRHMKGSIRLINITRITSVLAIIAATYFLILIILVLLFPRNYDF